MPTVNVVQSVDLVEITLTRAEALKLMKLFGRLIYDGHRMQIEVAQIPGGGIEDGTRRVTSDIYNLLADQGIRYADVM